MAENEDRASEIVRRYAEAIRSTNAETPYVPIKPTETEEYRQRAIFYRDRNAIPAAEPKDTAQQELPLTQAQRDAARESVSASPAPRAHHQPSQGAVLKP